MTLYPYLPFFVLLVFMSTSIRIAFTNKTDISINKIYNKGLSNVSYKLLILLFTYIIYIIFCLSKKISIDIGATDAYYYMTYYLDIPSSYSFYLRNITTFEPGYSTITWIFRQFTSNYYIMLFFWHSLTYYLLIKFLNKLYLRKNSLLSIFIILTLLISQFNTLRMSVSIAIALMAILAIMEKKWIFALIIIFIAMSIQISAFILIPALLICFILSKFERYRNKYLIIIISLGIILSCGSVPFLILLMSKTAKGIYIGKQSLALGMYFSVLVVSALSFYKYKEMVKLNPLNKYLITILPVCLICAPLQYYISIMYRLTLYFVPIIAGLIPSLCCCYSKKRNSALGFGVKIILYSYMLLRIYSFFTEEIRYVGPYILK